jgi:hypothetical protein
MEPISLEEYYAGGPRTLQEAFPPICLRTHWDPTVLTSHVLPQAKAQHDLSLDPRPATKICFTYYHMSAGDAPLPPAPESTLPSTPSAFLGGAHRPSAGQPALPPGGAASRGFPYQGFHPGSESDLQLLNIPLTRCAEKKYPGPPSASMGIHTLPGANLKNDSSLSPLLTTVSQQAGCREADDAKAWDRSNRLFFNPTRYDRTTMVPTGLKKAESRNPVC